MNTDKEEKRRIILRSLLSFFLICVHLCSSVANFFTFRMDA
jgi:hypothetical protein